MSLKYLFVRMWATPEECQDSDKPHYIARLDTESGIDQWTLTRIFNDSHFFKKLVSAQRVIRGVQRIKSRLERGWLFEIIHIEEEIIESNVEEEKEVSA